MDHPNKRFVYDPVHSNSKQVVWRDREDDMRPIVTFPGTNILNPKDLISDLCIAVGAEHLNPRFLNAKKSIHEIRKETKLEPTLVSHSLGASINEYVGRFYPRTKQINVNKGAGLGSINRGRGIDQTDIHVACDCVSCLGYCNNCLPTGRSINICPSWRNWFRCCGVHKFDNIESIEGEI